MNAFNFHPIVQEWFSTKFPGPTQAQTKGWPAILAQEQTLIAAPTGSGKTLAAFLALIDRLFKKALDGTLQPFTQVVYVSPLRALSNDIHRNLETPLAEIESLAASQGLAPEPLRIAVRTGDTPPKDRQAMVRQPPHILVTTPESLYLLLTSVSGQAMLSQVETVIVDEIHALADNRRGSHLTLTLERLGALTPHRLQRIGLSATQSPMETVAQYLTGVALGQEPPQTCTVIDEGHLKALDLEIVIPSSPLEAVISHEVWAELYRDLVERILAHRTTLIFVQTRSKAERVTHNLAKLLGEGQIAAHHGSMATKMRLQAEQDLKNGSLRAIVATASLELGIDIGHVELVCQIGSPRAISAVLQRVGRSGHHYGGVPKGRLYPLSRDQLVECTALLQAIRQKRLDQLVIPQAPLDILAQQIVACAAHRDWALQELFDLMRRAYPYRNLTLAQFEEVIFMLAEGIATRRGRRGALIYFDAINRIIKGRRGARLQAITNGGAIPDNLDYKVVLEPDGTYLGTINEDFAIESSAGDIFQLGNASWQIAKVETGIVRVHGAHGLPPTIPFWLGETPGRTPVLSEAVSDLRQQAEALLAKNASLETYFSSQSGIPADAARQIAVYFETTYKVLGHLPHQKTLIMERFFDEGGGMQLILHAPFGSRINRAWGLALRKRFCRSFNFELQAAATDDAILLSLGPTHAFPLAEVFDYLNPQTVRDVLIQAMLDAPMFQTHFRWNAQRALAISRQRGGKRVPAFLQRMAAEDLIAVVFPDQLACLENIAGDREIPDHPLVQQTVADCLHEVMDIEGLVHILSAIRDGSIQRVALDLPEPSPMAHEILNASNFAFLDDAGLEERRTHAVQVRRTLDPKTAQDMGRLDTAAIDAIHQETWPNPRDADELHDAIFQCGGLTSTQLAAFPNVDNGHLEQLLGEGRVTHLFVPNLETPLTVATERIPIWQIAQPEATHQPEVTPPERDLARIWELDTARSEICRSFAEVSGPLTADLLQKQFGFSFEETEGILLRLEGEGTLLRGYFDPRVQSLQWCHRRILARIHQRTLNRLRSEIKPVNAHIFMRFLFHWQQVEPASRGEGQESLMKVISSLEGFEAAAGRWESDLLSIRLKTFSPGMLDQLCLQGRVGWGRRTAPNSPAKGSFQQGPLKTSPISLFPLENLEDWFWEELPPQVSPKARSLWDLLCEKGALFFHQIQSMTRWLHTECENALGELVACGMARSDSFSGLRALLTPSQKRPSPYRRRTQIRKALDDVTLAGRWSALRANTHSSHTWNQTQLEAVAKALLRRYGIVFRKLLERETPLPPWRELLRTFRNMEGKGEIRGGHFVSGFGGEHFALPEAVATVRKFRREAPDSQPVVIHAADPLNLIGIILPGAPVALQPHNRILMLDGLPIAAKINQDIISFDRSSQLTETEIQNYLNLAARRGSKRRLTANPFR